LVTNQHVEHLFSSCVTVTLLKFSYDELTMLQVHCIPPQPTYTTWVLTNLHATSYHSTMVLFRIWR